MSRKTPIKVPQGDGISPEIMEASLHIVQAAGAPLEIETIEIGGKVYLHKAVDGIQLRVVDDRGAVVWPGGMAEASAGQSVTPAQISALYQKVTAAGYDIVKTETLRTFDGQQGFTLAQGR